MMVAWGFAAMLEWFVFGDGMNFLVLFGVMYCL
jgi:hypothetical protein